MTVLFSKKLSTRRGNDSASSMLTSKLNGQWTAFGHVNVTQ